MGNVTAHVDMPAPRATLTHTHPEHPNRRLFFEFQNMNKRRGEASALSLRLYI